MAGQLEGKVAFITGAARGQGRSHAVRLASEGADIIGIDICAPVDGVEYPMPDESDLAETADLVKKHGRRMVTAVADVRDREGLAAAFNQGVGELGRCDYVIANAGVMPLFGPRGREFASWQLCLDILLTGVLNTVECSYGQLVRQGEGGSIVITSSLAGLQPMMVTENAHTYGLLGYSTAKAGLVSLARNYASLLGQHYIRVNTIHPTGVNTLMCHNDMMDQHWATADPGDSHVVVHAIPVMEVQPEDISAAVLWLCSNESRYFTGHQLPIDAGGHLGGRRAPADWGGSGN
ncbi:MAG: mycofactocin-coupled SDR family oxidoreductase [Trebonia sp.]|jgi:SDR family mycofactocin-dependent oxidoreductase